MTLKSRYIAAIVSFSFLFAGMPGQAELHFSNDGKSTMVRQGRTGKILAQHKSRVYYVDKKIEVNPFYNATVKADPRKMRSNVKSATLVRQLKNGRRVNRSR